MKNDLRPVHAEAHPPSPGLRSFGALFDSKQDDTVESPSFLDRMPRARHGLAPDPWLTDNGRQIEIGLNHLDARHGPLRGLIGQPPRARGRLFDMGVARRKVIFAAYAAAGATALAFAAPASGAVGRGAVSSPHWRVVASVPGFLDAIVAPTRTSAWALGWSAHPPEGPVFPVGRAWNGHRWSRAQLPGISDSESLLQRHGSRPDRATPEGVEAFI